MRGVHVLGVGATSFTGAGRAAGRVAQKAASAALADAGVAPADVGAIVLTGGRVAAQDLGELAGTRRRVLDVASASGVGALHSAWDAVASGAHDVVLCVGHDRTGTNHAPPIADLARAAGAYMDASGATERHLARVAANCRLQGADNPRALLTTPVDADTVLQSEVLAWPLHRLMVAEPSQGAAAVVLVSADRGERRPGARAPRVRACIALGAADRDGAALDVAARAARLAYRTAKLGPDDVDCAEIADPTSAGELEAYEALQFAPEGQGPDLVDSGFTARGGVLPVNTSGGLLAQGDAVAAGPLAQLCELTWQLRGEAGRRQVAGARAGLALATAPAWTGESAVVGVTILTTG